MADQALSGIKVLDLTWHISGPYCTKMFADYGADVLKIERPGGGDPARAMGPFLGDDPHPEKSLLFSHLNLNKRGITLNLKSATGKKMFKELVRDADILVESFSPGVMKRFGLDYETLKGINPKLVMTSISNFGQTGPYRDYKASELVLMGIGADQISHGIPDREPLKKGGNAIQYNAGIVAAGATISGYWFAMMEEIGQHIDVSMQETQAGTTDYRSYNLLCNAYSGEAAMGRQDPRMLFRDITPSGVFPCKDGFVRAAGGIMFWDRFVKLFPEVGEKYQYPFDVLNLDYKPEVDAMWYSWCADRTKQEIMETCQAAKYFCTAINTPMDAVESPQFAERGYWVEVAHPVSGKQIYPGDPFTMTETPWRVTRPAPTLGQHNAEVYCDQLGYAREDLVRLREAGAI